MIRFLLDLYTFIIIADVILSYFPNLRGQNWVYQINRLAEFTCKPVRKILPRELPIDFSPFVVILGINLLKLLW